MPPRGRALWISTVQRCRSAVPSPTRASTCSTRYGEPVPLGVRGGALHRRRRRGARLPRPPELTAERFVADPFSGEPGARMYRTGDLARYRRRRQTSSSSAAPTTRSSCAASASSSARSRRALCRAPGGARGGGDRARGRAGDRRLVAYVAGQADADDDPLELVAALRRHLAESLPDYMVPSAFVRLDALPLTPTASSTARRCRRPTARRCGRDRTRRRAGRHRGDPGRPLGRAARPRASRPSRQLLRARRPLAPGRAAAEPRAPRRPGRRAAAARAVRRGPPWLRWPGRSARLVDAERRPRAAAHRPCLARGRPGPVLRPAAALVPGPARGRHRPITCRSACGFSAPSTRTRFAASLDCLVARHEALRSAFVSVGGEPRVELLPEAAASTCSRTI